MSELKYELERLVTVGTYTSPWEAQLAKARLEAEGIEAMIADENFIRLYWAISNAVGGVKVQVREESAPRAVEVLEREQPIPEIYLVTEDEAARPRCPACSSDHLTFERWSRLGFVGSWVLLGVPLPIPRRRWLCGHCGESWREDEIAGEAGLPVGIAPAEPPVLVTVARFTTPWEAHLAKGRLEAEGIEACVAEERLPPVSLLTGRPLALNRVEVEEADAERAVEILADESWEEGEDLPASE